MVMHTLGGLVLAFLGGAIFSEHIKKLPSFEIVVTILLFVTIIGMGWEYYEYAIQHFIKTVRLADWSDSISDMLCDMIGGAIGVFFVLRIKRMYNTHNG